MAEPTGGLGQIATASKQIARRLLVIGANRLQLLTVEVQEERERLLRSILLALGAAVFVLTLTAAIVVLFWPFSPLAALLTLTGLYGAAAVCLYWRLTGLLRNWRTLPASRDQLQKDRACLERFLQ
jgi:uncharacterized membrane protein YqjE